MQALLGASSHVSNDHLIQLAKCLDIDGSGCVEWIEWLAVALLSAENLPQAKEPLVTAFRVLDRPSSDESIGVADLLAVVNCAAAGENCSSMRARDMLCRALGKWASTTAVTQAPAPLATAVELNGVSSSTSRRKRRQEHHQHNPPSLTLRDIQRMLSAAGARETSEATVSSPAHCGISGVSHCWLPCCPGEAASPYGSMQVLVEQQPAAKNSSQYNL